MKDLLKAILVGLLLGLVTACGSGNEPYVETFDEPGTWRVGEDAVGEGTISNGVYDFLIKADRDIKWTTAGESFTDGVYEVEATQVDGPLDTGGYGLLFRIDDQNDNFYAFEISSDGFVQIASYQEGQQETILVDRWWFESSAIKQGLNQRNVLRVQAEGANLIFLVNDQEVGRVTDNTFASGDVGLMIESLGQGGVRVHFDNLSVTPLER